MKFHQKVKITSCRCTKLKKIIIMYWTNRYSKTGQPLLVDKKGNYFRVLNTDFSRLVTGNVYHGEITHKVIK